MDLDATLENEQDIEELRRVAVALHAQLQQTIRHLKRKCDQLALYTGNKDELQQTLALIDQLTSQSKAAEKAAAQAEEEAVVLGPDRAAEPGARAAALRARRR